jgi:hypothetical protein
MPFGKANCESKGGAPGKHMSVSDSAIPIEKLNPSLLEVGELANTVCQSVNEHT